MAYGEKGIENIMSDNIIHNWEACVERGPFKENVLLWSSPPVHFLKFNADRTARGKPGPGGKVAFFVTVKENICLLFSKHVGIGDSNKSEVLVILKDPHFFKETPRLFNSGK